MPIVQVCLRKIIDEPKYVIASWLHLQRVCLSAISKVCSHRVQKFSKLGGEPHTQFSAQISSHYGINNRNPLWKEYWSSLLPLCLENTISTANSFACRNERKYHNQLAFSCNCTALPIHFHNFISEPYTD